MVAPHKQTTGSAETRRILRRVAIPLLRKARSHVSAVGMGERHPTGELTNTMEGITVRTNDHEAVIRAGGSRLARFFLRSSPFHATINRPVRYAGLGQPIALKREVVRYANRCSASESSL
jgi:hypothetical protein